MTGKPLGDAFVHALARQLDAAPVDAALLAEQPQQLAVAAPMSSTFAPGATMSATSTRSTREPPGARAAVRHGEIALETRQHRHLIAPRLEAARLGGAVEEAAHDREQLRLLEQERVVALVGDDLGERDARRRRR